MCKTIRHVNVTKSYLHFGRFEEMPFCFLLFYVSYFFYLYFPNQQKTQFRQKKKSVTTLLHLHDK